MAVIVQVFAEKIRTRYYGPSAAANAGQRTLVLNKTLILEEVKEIVLRFHIRPLPKLLHIRLQRLLNLTDRFVHTLRDICTEHIISDHTMKE